MEAGTKLSIIVAIPYKTFKEKIRATKENEKKYSITDLGGVLYMERKIGKRIRVKCVEGFRLYDNKGERIIANVDAGQYIAKLFKETEEYFAKDSEGREFLVGQININGNLELEEGFELLKD